MHAVLEEMKIPHDYREFDSIAHNLKLLADQVQDGNFAFAARSFKSPQFDRDKALWSRAVAAADQSCADGAASDLNQRKRQLSTLNRKRDASRTG